MLSYVHSCMVTASLSSAGAFYFMLGNLPPQQRSITRGIQLLILVKYLVIERYGIDKILEPLIKDLRKLVC